MFLFKPSDSHSSPIISTWDGQCWCPWLKTCKLSQEDVLEKSRKQLDVAIRETVTLGTGGFRHHLETCAPSLVERILHSGPSKAPPWRKLPPPL